jgi:hypothetical protein
MINAPLEDEPIVPLETMKNHLLLLAGLSFLFSSADAQEDSTGIPLTPAIVVSNPVSHDEEPVTRAKKLSDKLKADLKLTEDQTQKAYDAFLDQFTKEKMLNEKKAMKADFKKLADETDNKIKTIFGEIKYANYKTMRKDNHTTTKTTKTTRVEEK